MIFRNINTLLCWKWFQGDNGSPTGFDWRHDGPSHWILHSQWSRDHLLPSKVFLVFIISFPSSRFFMSLKAPRAEVVTAVKKDLKIIWQERNRKIWFRISYFEISFKWFRMFDQFSSFTKYQIQVYRRRWICLLNGWFDFPSGDGRDALKYEYFLLQLSDRLPRRHVFEQSIPTRSFFTRRLDYDAD